MKRPRIFILVNLCLLWFGILSNPAAVLTYGTFTGSDPDSSETTATFDLTTGAIAVGFTSNASAYTLSSVSFDLSRQGNSTARLRIYSGTNPGGTALFTSGNVGLSTSAAVVTFSGFGISLTAGQTYWLVVDSNSGNGSLRVHSAAGNQTASGTANLSMVGYRVYNENLTSHGGAINSDLPNFTVTVPEPHEYAMAAGIGLCLFALYRRRFIPAPGATSEA